MTTNNSIGPTDNTWLVNLAPEFRDAKVAKVHGGYSGNDVFRLELPDRTLCVKDFNEISAADYEWNILRALEQNSVSCVPSPLFRCGNDNKTIVMSWCEGTPLGNQALTVEQVDALATALETFGKASVDLFPPATNSVSRVIERAQTAWKAIRKMQPTNEIVADLDALVSELIANADILRHSQTIWVGRGDPNLANALWNGEVRFVDVEHAGRNDRDIELADLAEHLQSHECGEEVWSRLWERLGLSVEARQRILMARRLTAIWWLGELLTNPLAKQLNPPERMHEQISRVRRLLADS